MSDEIDTDAVPSTVLSGIRATGRLHFGNFMGAVRHFVEYQKPGIRSMYFIADLHTLTTLRDPEELRSNVLEITKDYLAAGLDPDQSVIYAQSSVPEIMELSLLLSMLQPVGQLQAIPTFKDKVRKQPNDVNLGLLSYPVLMAADILGPRATLVPVGEDQRPNVELARNLAERFNNRFGKLFTLPEMLLEMVKVPGLDGEKMGKSEADNAINLDAPIEDIRKRYLRLGITDPERIRASDPGDPFNRCRAVYPLHEMITLGEHDSREIATACQNATIGCVECKNRLVESIAVLIEPFQERRRELASQDALVREVLHEGGKKARQIITETTAIVRDKMGIVIY